MKSNSLLIVLCLLPAATFAEQIQTRAELNTILGSAAITDDFEIFQQVAGSFVTFEGDLDSTRIIEGQGPNLVNPGASYGPGQSGWANYLYAAGYQGLPSQMFQSESKSFDIRFSSPVYAAGVDITSFYTGGMATHVFFFFENSTFVDVPFIARAGQTDFVGWREEGGIYSIRVWNEGSGANSPLLDNSTYGGTPVPERPTATPLCGLCAAFLRRRKPRA